jgi:DNA (cytosine-5)-methyltransferase 1
MKAISLFAGVGGFDLALTRNGAEVVASVEIDKNARKILEKQFPNTTHLEDVKNVTGQQLFDLGFDSNGIIVGGFPCQDLSRAGKRAGLAGERSGLFWEMRRIIEETQAKYFIFENVQGALTSDGGRDLGIILGSLAQIGYGVAYRVLDARYFGVPQRRRRIFIVGVLGDTGKSAGQILDIKGSLIGGFGKDFEEGDETSPIIRKSIESKSRYLTFSKVRRAQNKEDYETWTDRNFANTLNLFDNAGPTRATELLIRNELFEQICIECGNDDSLEEHPFCSECIEIGYESWKFVRRMTPLEFERLQGFPDNWTEGMPDSFRYSAMGNAVAVPVVDWIIKRLIEASHDMD